MLHADGSNVRYKTYRVRNDARLIATESPNDCLQSVNKMKGEMRNRLATRCTIRNS
jgi:hypothetical protein